VLTYKKYVTIDDPAKLILTDLPFEIGQRVEILVIAEDEQDMQAKSKLRELFQTTQALPQARAITEQEIAAEIENYRIGK
jgi:hypothetical protein